MKQYFGPVFHTTYVMKILNKRVSVYVVTKQLPDDDYPTSLFNYGQLVESILKYPTEQIIQHNRLGWETSNTISAFIESSYACEYGIYINSNQFTIKHIPLEIK